MGSTKDGNLCIASNVHVVRGKNDDGSPKIVTIPAGKMVSDTDLKAAEIEQLKAHGVLRFPAQAEIDALDAAADAADAAESAAAEAAQAEIDAQRKAAGTEEKATKGKK